MGGKVGGAKQSLRFMYAPPPGVAATGINDVNASSLGGIHLILLPITTATKQQRIQS